MIFLLLYSVFHFILDPDPNPVPESEPKCIPVRVPLSSGSCCTSLLVLRQSEKPDPDAHQNVKPDPDAHQNKKPDPDGHQNEKPRAVKAHNRAMKAGPWRLTIQS